MPRNVSADAFKAMFAQETEEVFLMCLTMEHADLGAPIRVVNNNENIARAAGTFYACFFDIQMPDEAPDSVPQVNLTIENVDRAITDAIRTLTGRVKLTMEVVMASSPNTVEAGPFEFYMLSANFNSQLVQGRLGFEDDILNLGFPKDAYTPVTAPGLFK